MIEIKKSKVDGLHCYQVVVTKMFHGPTHRPILSAKLGLMADGRPVGNMEIEDLPEDLTEIAEDLLKAVEEVVVSTVSEEAATSKPEKPKSLIEEF
tara:strand:+ start:6991 stop:7278 length:288 start_codon:yes stop_codon:yes gene_type:complete